MAMQLEKRLRCSLGCVRQSERTTAEEVRMTQMELDQQLGGLYSLTVDWFHTYQENLRYSRSLERYHKSRDMVKPTIVAGVTLDVDRIEKVLSSL